MLLAGADFHPPGAFQTHGPFTGKVTARVNPLRLQILLKNEALPPPMKVFNLLNISESDWLCRTEWVLLPQAKHNFALSAQWCFLPHK